MLLAAAPFAEAGAPLTCEAIFPGEEISHLPRGYWGIAANQNLPDGNTLENHQLLAGLLSLVHARVIRMMDLRWDHVQPDQGSPPDWGERADFYQAYKDQGFWITVAVRGTPEWAASEVCEAEACHTVSPDLSLWETFMGQAAAEFDGVVDAWEIWNEPNNTTHFTGSPQEYVDMLNTAYDAVKAVAPAVEVWGPETISLCPGELRPFEEAVAEFGQFDSFSAHIYCFQGTQEKIEVFDELRALLDANGHSGAPLRITETNDRVNECDIDPDLQANVLEELYSCFALAGATSVHWWKPTDTCGCPLALVELGGGLVRGPEMPEGPPECSDPDDVRDNGIVTEQYVPKPAHARYAELVERTALFVDGFESGDTSAWSLTVEEP